MQSRVSAQSHLEYRPSGFHWRRRWPRRVLKICNPSKKFSLLFSLRSHVLPEAKALAQKLTLLSDIAFAGVTERTMAIAPDIMERLLVGLCRFLIEAADAVREMAPMRTSDVAAYELACANAAVETMRQVIATRDREVARDPLRQVAARLGIALDEADPDWQRLAFRALRVMLDAQQENLRRDRGDFEGPSAALQAARPLADGANGIDGAALSASWVSMPSAPQPAPVVLPMSPPGVHPSAAPTLPQQQMLPAHHVTAPAPAPVKPAVAPAPPAPQAAGEGARCPIITGGTELYVELRSKGYRSFKPTEQADENAGASWARNSAPNVRSTGCLFA